MRTKGLRVVVRASYAELVAVMAEELREVKSGSLRDLLEPEWVVTPSLGTKTWLIRQISQSIGVSDSSTTTRTDGIVANWCHDFPARIAGRVLEAHRQTSQAGENDRWSLPRLALELHELGDTVRSEKKLAENDPRRLLCDDTREPSFERSRHYAELFDHYHVWRRDMIQLWSRNQQSDPFSGEEESQKNLWRALRERTSMGVPAAERWDEAWQRVMPGASAEELGLPTLRRLSVFGLTTFPGTAWESEGGWTFDFVESLTHLATLMPVTVYVVRGFHGSPLTGITNRYEFKSGIMRLWGGLALANHQVLDALIGRATITIDGDLPDLESHIPTSPRNFLEAMQQVLRSDRDVRVAPATASPDEEPNLYRDQLAAMDGSVVEHWCHGHFRQAEVLRDAIRHDLNDHAGDWTESDLLVVCPDLDTFAPMIRAAFGPARGAAFDPSGVTPDDEEPAVAYRIINPSSAGEGIYLQSLRHLLSLVGGRLERSAVLAFLSEPAVGYRWRFSTDDLEQFSEWTRSAAVRWGFDDAHRRYFGVTIADEVQTWRKGLDRLILGTMMANRDLRPSKDLLGVEIAGARLDLFHKFVTVVEGIGQAVSDVRTARTLPQWMNWIDNLSALYIRPDPKDDSEFEAVRRALNPLLEAGKGSQVPLSYLDFVVILDDALTLTGSSGGLLSGGVTITTPDTLRWIPYKAIYVLGMDDDAFLRPSWSLDDLRRPRIGDKSKPLSGARPGEFLPSDDGRSRLVEIFLSAQEKITILRTYRDLTTNAAYEPGIAYAEYRDQIELLAPSAPDGSPIGPVIVQHPRHGFSGENFLSHSTMGDAASHHPWSFSNRDFSLSANRYDQSLLMSSGTLPKGGEVKNAWELVRGQITLDDLANFISDPMAEYARRVLGITLNDWKNDDSDELSVDLEKYQHRRVVNQLARHVASSDTTIEKVMRLMGVNGDLIPFDLARGRHIDLAAAALAEHIEGRVAESKIIHEHIREDFATLFQDVAPARDIGLSWKNFPEYESITLLGSFDAFASGQDLLILEPLSGEESMSKSAKFRIRQLAAAATGRWGSVSLDLIAHRKDPVKSGPDFNKFFTTKNWPSPPDRESACATLSALVLLYLENLRQPIVYESSEKEFPTDEALGHIISTDAWRREDEYSTKKYLARSTWKFVLGDCTLPELYERDGYEQFGVRFVGQHISALISPSTTPVDDVEGEMAEGEDGGAND